MRNDWRALAVVVVVSAFAVVGCSSTQPDVISGVRDASISFEGKASVLIWDCFDTACITDQNGNEQCQPRIKCFEALDAGGVQRVEPRSVPIRYSLEITVIRAGTTEEVLVTSVDGALGSSIQPDDVVPDFASLTNYDSGAMDIRDKIENVGTPTNPILITWKGGREVSTGSPEYLAIRGVDPGIPNILDTPPPPPPEVPPFVFSLNTGDTVVVRARKEAESTWALHELNQATDPRITASLSISGSAVVTKESETVDMAGFTFSFTLR